MTDQKVQIINFNEIVKKIELWRIIFNILFVSEIRLLNAYNYI